MTGKELKDWATLLPDCANVEIKHFSWEPLDASKLRAVIPASLKVNDDSTDE